MSDKIVQRNPNQLREHPMNAKLYGNHVDDDFVDSCREIIHSPIHVAADGTIVSGHRRRRAAMLLGKESVPVIVHEDLYDDDEILEMLILLNKQRVKTKDQIAREAALLFDTEKSLADKRRRNGVKVEDGQKSRADDKVAAAVGVSRTTVVSAATAGKAILAAEEAGDDLKARELVRMVNEEGFSATARAVKPKERKLGEPVGGHSKEAQAVRRKFGDMMRAVDSLLHAYNTSSSRAHYKTCRELLDSLHKEIAEWTKD